MRAVFLHGGAAWDGEARIFAAVARALAARGHETWLAAPAGSEAAVQAVSRGTAVVALPVRRSALADARCLKRSLPRGFVEAIFVHDDDEHMAAALAVRWAGRGGIVRRVAAGERLARSWWGRRAEQLVPARYLYTSESPPTGHAVPSGTLSPMRAELGVEFDAEAGGAPGSSVATDGGVARHVDATAGAEPLVLVCVASRSSLRRATNVVRAAALLAQRHRTLRLRVLGSVAADDELKLLAAALGIAGRVEWVGHPPVMAQALRGAAAGWVIADGDEAALGALDLMAQGVAVLAERSPVMGRYVNHGIQGTLMPSLDPPLMAAETATLLSDRDRREAMGAAGRSRVEREFPFRDMVAAFEHATRAARERL